MAIISPYNSFVEFGPPVVDCNGKSSRAPLPVYDNLGIKFQFSTDELLPTDTIFKAAVCSSDCEIISNPDYSVVPICTRIKFMTTVGELLDSHFPLLVGNYSPQPGQPQIPEGLYTREGLIDIINELYETNLPGIDFSTCCEPDYPEISGIIIFLNATGSAQTLTLEEFYGTAYVNYPATEMDGLIDDHECFRYCILNEEDEAVACSGLFYREPEECWTTLFTYYNEENSYGLRYVVYDDNGTDRITENSIRLKVNFSKPQFPVAESIYRQPNGFQQRINTTIEKEWIGKTDWLDGTQHERLIVALKHDFVHVNNADRNIDYRMTQIGDYDIQWPEIRTDTAPAEFQINDFQNNNVNNNCGFECGVEFSPSCDGDGGNVVIPWPEKYSVEFTGSDGVMEPGNLIYQNDNLINVVAIEVYREGLFQHNSGSNNVAFDPSTGEVTFTPMVELNERIAIWEV